MRCICPPAAVIRAHLDPDENCWGEDCGGWESFSEASLPGSEGGHIHGKYHRVGNVHNDDNLRKKWPREEGNHLRSVCVCISEVEVLITAGHKELLKADLIFFIKIC